MIPEGRAGEVLAEMASGCLQGRPAPSALDALVRDAIEGGPLLRAGALGGLELLTAREGPWLRRFLAASPLKAAASYTAMFEEVAFFLSQRNGNLIGLWYRAADRRREVLATSLEHN